MDGVIRVSGSTIYLPERLWGSNKAGVMQGDLVRDLVV